MADPRRWSLDFRKIRSRGSILRDDRRSVYCRLEASRTPLHAHGRRTGLIVSLRFDYGAVVFRAGRLGLVLCRVVCDGNRNDADPTSGRISDLRVRQYFHVFGWPSKLSCDPRRI